VAISVATGRELGRVVRDGLGHELLNRVVAGVVSYGGAGAAQSAPGQTGAGPAQAAAQTGSFAIRPPSTGDAGLR
jgi:hypothetical protein